MDGKYNILHAFRHVIPSEAEGYYAKPIPQHVT